MAALQAVIASQGKIASQGEIVSQREIASQRAIANDLLQAGAAKVLCELAERGSL